MTQLRSHFLTKQARGGNQGHWEEGEGSGPTMDEGIPNMEIPYNPFEEIGKLQQELATLKAIIEEKNLEIQRKDLKIQRKDLKVQELEEELMAQKYTVSRLSGTP